MSIEKTNIDFTIEEYLLSQGQNDNECLEHIFISAYDYPEPYMQISKLQASILQSFIKQNNIRTIYEVGTFVGFSSFVMAKALPSDEGSVTSVEIEKDFYERALLNMDVHKKTYKNKDISQKLHYIYDDAKNHLKSMSREKAEKIDMFFLDGDKHNYDWYYNWAVNNLRSGSYFIIDNILFKGKVVTDITNEYAQSIRAMTERFHSENKFDYYFIPVGDCMLVAKKR